MFNVVLYSRDWYELWDCGFSFVLFDCKKMIFVGIFNLLDEFELFSLMVLFWEFKFFYLFW